ncbi:MAG TPA: hypothetical protein VM580_21510, partial [Labilithrix sp.]|nr:hypothetical protein [Labilithrix sp.]
IVPSRFDGRTADRSGESNGARAQLFAETTPRASGSTSPAARTSTSTASLGPRSAMASDASATPSALLAPDQRDSFPLLLAMTLRSAMAMVSAKSWARAPFDSPERSAVRPSKREGTIGLDVLVEGERLVVGFETPVWVRVVPPTDADAARVTLHVDPEAGLRVDKDEAKTSCDGWAEIAATAEGHVTGMQVEAKDAAGRKGVWFGALPVAPGAFFVGAPRFVPENKAEDVVLVAPNPRNVVYAEVDDERGRVFAAALPLAIEPGDPVPRARFTMPPLAPGIHWLVVSGEPRGAEKLAGAAIAKPFLVGGAPGVRPAEACSLGPWLARRPASGFPRWLAVDGMETRGAANRARHRLGLFIGLASLLVAAVLEVILLTAASREARAAMAIAGLDETDAERERVTAKTPGGSLAVALLVALLGFALLAALIVAKG